MIAITINQLRQYRHIKANILLLEQEMDELILKSKSYDGLVKSSAVSDTVAQIVLLREKKRERINYLTERKTAIEGYLSACDDYYGLLLRWHYAEGKTWNAIAMTIGGNNTANGIRMACRRYVDTNP